MAETQVKMAPNSKESEMMVLGCMLTSVNGLNVAADALDENDFYYTEHKIVFQTLKGLYKRDKPADVHLVCEELKRQNKLDTVGGVSYITALAQYAGTSAYMEEYAEIVRNKSVLRKMIQAAQKVEGSALQEPEDVHGALDEAQQIFFAISQHANPLAGNLISDILLGVHSRSQIPYLKELEQRQERFRTLGPNDPGITGLPTHFTDLDKMINGLAEANFIILAARPAMGKCVTGDTLILDPATGALAPIKTLVERRSGQIVTLDSNWKLRPSTPAAFVADGVKPTFQITTALGKEIEATAVHPLLTISGWKRVEELIPGDRIAIPRSLPYFGKKQWPDHQLKMLAYLIADGSLTRKQPEFTNTSPKIIEDFRRAALAFGAVRIHDETQCDRAPAYWIALDRSGWGQLKNTFSEAFQSLSRSKKRLTGQIAARLGLHPKMAYQWAAAGSMPSYSAALALEEELPSFAKVARINPVTAFLEELGLMGKGSHEKFFPAQIFELTKENIALFINRLFSCDGTAHVALCAGRPFPVIAYSSLSKTVIHQLQHLLLRFGILAKMRSKKTTCNGKIFPSFELEIHGRNDLIRFCQEIGIHGKEDAIQNVFETALKSTPGGSKDTLPLEIWSLIRKKKGSRSWCSLFRNKGLSPPSHLHASKRSIRRDTLARIAHVLDDSELMQIATSDVYWDRITKIASTGHKEVFDLSVNGTHNFVAGDIIVHNTALALNIAENICFQGNKPVGIFSLEMTAEQLLHRIICSQSEVESDKIRTGAINGGEYQRIHSAVNGMLKHTMIIDDQPGLKITDLRARARRMREAYGIEALVIDYLQLISGSGSSRSAESRQNEISEISRMLKTLARELDIPIICLSQLSRKVEERTGHRPMMSDLRESGSLEQDSDIVLFLLRREYYDPLDKPGMAELIVAKNRHGRVGSVQLTYRKELAQFANFTPAKFEPSDMARSGAFEEFSVRE